MSDALPKSLLERVQEELSLETYVGPYRKHPKRLFLALEWGLLGLRGDATRARSWAWLPAMDRMLALELLSQTTLGSGVSPADRARLEKSLCDLGALAPRYSHERGGAA